MKAIRTEKLTKLYGKSRGITEVSLSVEQGDFFGFIGPNGAGKSTTIRTLLGLISPTAGEGEILGLDIKKARTEILAKTGYLPSEAAFYQGMRVRDILALSARMRGLDCHREADVLCRRLGLDTAKRIHQLSLGNRKKVGIVCALQHNPQLYILDEPTSGLDPLIQKEFFSILEERNKAGATVFLSSHVLSEVGRYCKHAAIIREGRLQTSDSIENLRYTGIKRVCLRGTNTPPKAESIRDIKIENNTVTFLYSGEAKSLLKEISDLSFSDITISDPPLEEVFLHYYETEGT